MNEKIIAELNDIKNIVKAGFVKYGIKDFMNDIDRIEETKIFIESKDYEFLSINEAVECAFRS